MQMPMGINKAHWQNFEQTIAALAVRETFQVLGLSRLKQTANKHTDEKSIPQ